MKKIVLGTVLASGVMLAGTAQAHTEDALIGGLLGVTVGASIASQHGHRHVIHQHDHRPTRHVYHTYPRHVHHHPRGQAHGYWRKHGKHHYAHHRKHQHRYGWRGRDDHDDDRHSRRWRHQD